MIVTLADYKEVRFLNTMGGIERMMENAPADVWHIYRGQGAKFVCCSVPLTSPEREEAEAKFEAENANRNEMLANLVAPSGDQLIAEIQGLETDEHFAPMKIRRLFGIDLRKRVTWGNLKSIIAEMRLSKALTEEASAAGAVPFHFSPKRLPMQKFARWTG